MCKSIHKKHVYVYLCMYIHTYMTVCVLSWYVHLEKHWYSDTADCRPNLYANEAYNHDFHKLAPWYCSCTYVRWETFSVDSDTFVWGSCVALIFFWCKERESQGSCSNSWKIGYTLSALFCSKNIQKQDAFAKVACTYRQFRIAPIPRSSYVCSSDLRFSEVYLLFSLFLPLFPVRPRSLSPFPSDEREAWDAKLETRRMYCIGFRLTLFVYASYQNWTLDSWAYYTLTLFLVLFLSLAQTSTRESFRALLREGALDQRTIEVST